MADSCSKSPSGGGNGNGNPKKNFLVKTWERCRSVQGSRKEKHKYSKSKSWHAAESAKNCKRGRHHHQLVALAPEGCFSVYVGPEKQRFAMKAKYASHPLFMMLLEDAEMEYGYNSDGPITLPCDVDFFYKVLAEMETGGKYDDQQQHGGCGFAYASCSPFNPTRRLDGHSVMAKGYGSYGHPTPSRLIKMN